MRHRLRNAGFALSVLVALLPTGAPAGEAQPWNPQSMHALSVQLSEQLRAVRTAAAQAPEQDTVLQQRSRDAVVARVTRMQAVADQLRTQLEAGWGREETRGSFESVRDQARQALDKAGDAVPRKEPFAHFSAARETVNQMAPFYAGE